MGKAYKGDKNPFSRGVGLEDVIEKNIKTIGKVFVSNSKQRMPYASGALKANTKLTTKKDSFRVEQNKPYANRRYHENFKNPNKKEWFDKEWEANEERYNDMLLKGLGK